MTTTPKLDTSAPLVTTGALIFRCNATDVTRTIVAPQSWDIIPDDMFVVEDISGYRTYCRFTGRTRRFWGIDCPTIERWEVDTVVVDNFQGTGMSSIVGVPGARKAGTWATRPENVSFL